MSYVEIIGKNTVWIFLRIDLKYVTVTMNVYIKGFIQTNFMIPLAITVNPFYRKSIVH